MALELTRKQLIIGALLAIGFICFVLVHVFDPKANLTLSLLNLGIEGLKTGILFILIDFLIGDHESKKEKRDLARRDLKYISSGGASRLNEVFSELEDANGKVCADLDASHSLTSTKISGKKFEKCTWRGAILNKGEFVSTDFTECSLVGVDFKDRIFTSVKFVRVKFDRCDFTRALLKECSFDRCTFETCEGSDARVSSCTFSPAISEESVMLGATFENCEGLESS